MPPLPHPPPRPVSLELAVDLLNSWDVLESPPELIRDASVLEGWLRRLGYTAAADAVSPEDVPRLRAVRDRLRGAFEAAEEEEAVAILNGVVREWVAVPQLVRGVDGAWAFAHAVSPRTASEAVAPISALALLEVIREGGWNRFGVCDAAPCRCVYVDRSRNHTRRYCCELCADRMTQAAYRRRKKDAPAPGPAHD